MELKELFNKYNIKITENQVVSFDKYFNILMQENEKYNLTAIKQKDEVYLKHFIDSVLPCEIFTQNATVVDIGTGAGFPSIPLAILRPDLKFVLIDSVEKKVNFIKIVKNELNLQNITVFHGRCEDFAKNKEFRESFDYVVARAVAPLSSLIEYCVPFIKVNGLFVAYKGENVENEIKNSKNAINLLKIKQINVLKYKIEEVNATRYCIIYKKESSTPIKYPRGQNKVKLKPLN